MTIEQFVHVQKNFSGSNTEGSFTMAVSNSFLSPLEKSNICRFVIICGVFFFILKMVYCVYSLESPIEAILMRTNNIPSY